jgi:hypothetical protein
MEVHVMSETGRNISNGFATLREFCKNVALMLKTADALMDRHCWGLAAPLAYSNTSRSIDQPEIWLPSEFCRFYKNPQHSHLLAFIAVNLCDPVKANVTIVDEALISAGWFEWQAGKEPKDWDYWYCRAHIFRKDRQDNGTVISSDDPCQQVCRNFSGEVTKVTTFAYPLDSVTSSETLQKVIVNPLITEIANRSSSANRSD